MVVPIRFATALAVAGFLSAVSEVRAQLPATDSSGSAAARVNTVGRPSQSQDSLLALIRQLQQRIAALERSAAGVDSAAGGGLDAIRAAAARAAASAGAARSDTSPSSQAGAARTGQNALNPEISVSGDIRAVARDPGPQQETFAAREVEIAMQSALDPYSTAKIFVGFEDGEVALEEGYVYFTALPAHLRLDVGLFRQQIGELNRWHLHAVPSGEYPLVLRRFAGEEGLAGAGASLYWPVPVSSALGTYELTVQGTTGSNEVLHAEGGRLSYNAQLAGFYEIGRSAYAQLSISALHGSNPDTSLTTNLTVASARFTWRPPAQAQSREFTLRGEHWSLRRKFDLAGDDFFDRARAGYYVDASLRLSRRWVAGLRYDSVEDPEPGPLLRESAITPSLTYWQSEFVYMRAIYESAKGLDSSRTGLFSLQVVFAMGPHKHEVF